MELGLQLRWDYRTEATLSLRSANLVLSVDLNEIDTMDLMKHFHYLKL